MIFKKNYEMGCLLREKRETKKRNKEKDIRNISKLQL